MILILTHIAFPYPLNAILSKWYIVTFNVTNQFFNICLVLSVYNTCWNNVFVHFIQKIYLVWRGSIAQKTFVDCCIVW